MIIEGLFPVPLGCTDLGRKLTQKELDFFKRTQESGERKNNEGNTHTLEHYILDNPELSELKKDLTEKVNLYFRNTYKAIEDVEIYITISWINYTETNQYHHAHSHPNSVISGVYYIETDVSDTIIFSSPWPNKLTMYVETTELNQWNSDEWWYPTTENSVLLFPSKLVHHVNQVESEKTRISLAFNTFVKGKIGGDNLTELIIK